MLRAARNLLSPHTAITQLPSKLVLQVLLEGRWSPRCQITTLGSAGQQRGLETGHGTAEVAQRTGRPAPSHCG